MLKSQLKPDSEEIRISSQDQDTIASDSPSKIMSKKSKSKSKLKAKSVGSDNSSNKCNYNGSVARDGTPVISSLTVDHFRPSDVCHHSPSRDKVNSKNPSRLGVINPPTAKDSAFSGPPRYDWIHIETAAAIKIQSIVRRNKVMDELNSQNISTAAMRNRIRSQSDRRKKPMVSEDVPGILSFCGIGFLFGDATGEDQEVLKAHDKVMRQKQKVQRTLDEEKKRKLRYRRKPSEKLYECIEVVDN